MSAVKEKDAIAAAVKGFHEDINRIQADPTLNYAFEQFLGYASHLIQDQSIPQFYDGLLPSQRCHILSMQDIGALQGKKHQKSTRVVAHQTSNYRPVGNTYNVLVNMSQDWNTQVLLTDPEGSWGPQETGRASAERYTEIRLSKFSEAVILPDLPTRIPADREPHGIVPSDICEFGHLWEERYLPVKLPLLLLNGSNGIAVGISQTFQPLAYAPLLKQLLSFIKTGAFDYSALEMGYPNNCQIASPKEDVINAFKTGSGSVRTAGKYELVKKGFYVEKVVFTSVPPGVTLNSIGDAFNEQRRANSDYPFSSYRNESNKKGIRLVFTLKQPTADQHYLNEAIRSLYRQCRLMEYQTVNMVALKDNFPVRYNLESFLADWMEERRAILTRVSAQTMSEKERALRRLNILTFVKMFEERILTGIRELPSEEKIGELCQLLLTSLQVKPTNFITEWSQEDTKVLLSLNLRQLSKMNEEEHQHKLKGVLEEIAILKETITSVAKKNQIISDEIESFLKKADSLGVSQYSCPFDPELASFLEVKPGKAAAFVPKGVKPVANAEAEGDYISSLEPSTKIDIVVFTKNGLTYLIPNNSVRSTPFEVKLVGDDSIAQVFHSKHAHLPVLTGSGRVLFIEKDKLPTNTPITPQRLCGLHKSKPTDADFEFAVPIAVTGSKWLLIMDADSGQVKKVAASDITSFRQRVLVGKRPTWVALSDDKAPLKKELPLEKVKAVSYKQVSRLPTLGFPNDPNIWTISTAYGNTKLRFDATTIAKEL